MCKTGKLFFCAQLLTNRCFYRHVHLYMQCKFKVCPKLVVVRVVMFLPFPKFILLYIFIITAEHFRDRGLGGSMS